MGRGPEEQKRARAESLVLSGSFATSGQVLQEFYTVVTRKGAAPLSPARAFEWIERLVRFPCVPIDTALVIDAIAMSERYRISYWDGAILAAAESVGAKTLYTEDLNHGQVYGSVTVINPFL